MWGQRREWVWAWEMIQRVSGGQQRWVLRMVKAVWGVMIVALEGRRLGQGWAEVSARR